MSDTLSFKSPSIESLASAVHAAEDVAVLETNLCEAIDAGDLESVMMLLTDKSLRTMLLQILLMTTISNSNGKYSFDPDPAAGYLLGLR